MVLRLHQHNMVIMSRATSLIAFTLSILVAFQSGALATTYYVDDLDVNCNPSSPGAGTLADPWKNMYYATTRLQCGDTLKVRGGTYQITADGYSNSQCSTGNGEYAVMHFTQNCTSSNKITVEVYNNETVILDGTSSKINLPAPTSHWTRCESATQCGSCVSTSTTIADYQNLYYSKPFNFSGAKTPQMWIDPSCNDADSPTCTSPENTGTRLRWIYAGDGKTCGQYINALSGACNNSWSSPACGSFDTYAISNSIVARLQDGSDPDSHVVKISCQAGTCAAHVMEFTNAHYIDIKGGGNLYVKYGYYGAHFRSGASDIIIDGVKFHGMGGRDYGQCVRTGHGSNVTIRNSVCAEVAAEGIGFYGGGHGSCVQISGNKIENSLIYDTGFASSTGVGVGQSLDDGVIIKSCNNCVARGNTIYDNGRNGVEVTSNWNGSGLCDSDNVIIENNKISRSCNSMSPYASDDCGGVHLVRPGDGNPSGSIDGTIIRNNFIYDIVGLNPAFSPHGIKADYGITNTKILNNSLRNIAQECIDTNETAPAVGNYVVKNNAMYKCNSESVGGAAYVRINAASDWTHSNNTYWSDTNGAAVRIGSSTPYTRDTISGWESTAIAANPGFISASDLHLALSTSPMINKGADLTSLGFSTDIDGGNRPVGPWDIGADEFGAPGGGGGTPNSPGNLRIVP